MEARGVEGFMCRHFCMSSVVMRLKSRHAPCEKPLRWFDSIQNGKREQVRARTRKKRPACSPGATLYDSEAKSGFLQVSSRLLAALRYYIVGNALAFIKGAHSKALNRA